MTNRAWRARGVLHVECDACGSTGVPGGSHTHHDIDEAVTARTQENDHKLKLFRADFVGKHNDLTGQLMRKRITPEVFGERLTALKADFLEQAKTRLADAPKPGDGVTEMLAVCPWCAAPMGVAVTALPEGQTEPAN